MSRAAGMNCSGAGAAVCRLRDDETWTRNDTERDGQSVFDLPLQLTLLLLVAAPHGKFTLALELTVPLLPNISPTQLLHLTQVWVPPMIAWW